MTTASQTPREVSVRAGLAATQERRRAAAAAAPRATVDQASARRHRTERAAQQYAERVAPFVAGAGRRVDGGWVGVALLRADQAWLADSCRERGVLVEQL